MLNNELAAPIYSNSSAIATTTPRPTNQSATSSNNVTCAAECTLAGWNGETASFEWVQAKVTKTLTHATVIAIVNGNITSYSTKFNPNATQSIAPPTATDPAGTITSVITILGSDLQQTTTTLTYPTPQADFHGGVAWQGTLPRTDKAGSTQCLVRKSFTFESVPQSAAQTTPYSADPQDLRGWTYVLVGKRPLWVEDTLQKELGDFDPLAACKAPFIFGEQAFATASFATITSVWRVQPNNSII